MTLTQIQNNLGNSFHPPNNTTIYDFDEFICGFFKIRNTIEYTFDVCSYATRTHLEGSAYGWLQCSIKPFLRPP